MAILVAPRSPTTAAGLFQGSAVILLLLVAGGLIGGLPVSWATAIVIGSLALAIALARLEWALAVLIFSVPFGALRPVELGAIRATGTEVAALGVFLAWVLRGVLARRFEVRGWVLLGAFAVFAAAVTFSTVRATSLSLGLKELLKWGEFLVVFLAVASLAPRRAAPWLVGSLLVAATLEAVLGWAQFLLRLGPPGFVVSGLFLRAYGTFGQPNPYAGFLGFGLSLAAALALYRQPLSSPWWARYAPWFALVLGSAMLMSFSRGAWLAASIGIAVLLALSSARGLALVLVGALVGALLLFLGGLNLLPATIAARLTAFTNLLAVVDVRQVVVTAENWSLVERMVNWQTAWAMYEANPWFGIGLGNFGTRYGEFVPIMGWPNLTGHAHNYYLTLLGETGVVGLGGYLLFLVTAFGVATGAVRRTLSTETAAGGGRLAHGLAVGILAALVALTVHNGFDSLYVQGMTTLLGAYLGLAVAMTGEEQVAAP